MDFIDNLLLAMQMGAVTSNYTLHHPAIKRLLQSTDEHFDIVIMETVLNDAMLGIAHHFQAPVIGFSSFVATKLAKDLVGTPTHLSYVPNPNLQLTSDRMSFMERVKNTAATCFEYVCLNLVYMRRQRKLYEAIFPNATTTMDELRRNVSMIMVNSHVTVNYPQPFLPNVIEVAGLHLESELPELSPRLRSFIEGAQHGCIYFSWGSIIESSQLSPALRSAILNVFGRLRQRVLWKWEAELLTDAPANVLVQKWFPQQAILAHSNVRLFITHGGLLSVIEAINFGVPLVGVPFVGDQYGNMARAVDKGYAVTVHFSNLTETSFAWAINEVLNDER